MWVCFPVSSVDTDEVGATGALLSSALAAVALALGSNPTALGLAGAGSYASSPSLSASISEVLGHRAN